MSFKKIIVIGASAGGIPALKSLLMYLPVDFQAPILIVMHSHAASLNRLPFLINQYGSLPAIHPLDGQELKKGYIYIAPPDVHMIISKNKIYLRFGPKINFFRPAIDPLFYSAAYNYPDSTIGILLSGTLNDGTAGLLAIKKYHGTTIIQDLSEAEYPEMPRNALKNVPIDYCFPVKEIASYLIDRIK